MNSQIEPGGGQALELERWFGWQIAGWWRRWRGALLSCAGLLVLWVVYEIVNGHFIVEWQSHKPDYAAQGWEYHWVKSWRSIRLIEAFMFYGILGTVLASGAMLAHSLASLPEEVALAFSAEAAYRRRSRRIRTVLYLLFAAFLLAPHVLGGLNLWVQGLSGQPDIASTVLSFGRLLLKVVALSELVLLFALRWPRLHPYASTAAGLLMCLVVYGLEQWTVVQALSWSIDQAVRDATPSLLLTLTWNSPLLLFPLAVALSCLVLSRYPASPLREQPARSSAP